MRRSPERSLAHAKKERVHVHRLRAAAGHRRGRGAGREPAAAASAAFRLPGRLGRQRREGPLHVAGDLHPPREVQNQGRLPSERSSLANASPARLPDCGKGLHRPSPRPAALLQVHHHDRVFAERHRRCKQLRRPASQRLLLLIGPFFVTLTSPFCQLGPLFVAPAFEPGPSAAVAPAAAVEGRAACAGGAAQCIESTIKTP